MKIRLFMHNLALLLFLAMHIVAGPGAVAQDRTGDADQAPAARGSAASWAADLPVVSDGRHLWLWANEVDPKDEARRLTALYHADATHRPPDGPAWETVTTFTGRLAPEGAAADDDQLWLIFDDGRVASVSLTPGPLEDQWFYRQHAELSLPANTTVRASLAARGKLWVLARVETGQAIADLDRQTAAATATTLPAPTETDPDNDTDVLNLLLGLPREMPFATPEIDPPSSETGEAGEDAAEEAAVEAEDKAETEAEATPEAAPESKSEVESKPEPANESASESEPAPLPDAPADRLLVLDRGAWRVVPLPRNWTAHRPTRLITPRDDQPTPALLVLGAKANANLQATLFRPATPATKDESPEAEADRPVIQPTSPRWTATALELPDTGSVAALRLQQQLILVQHTPGSPGSPAAPASANFAAQVWAVRGDQLTAIGQVALDETTQTPAHGLWTAMRFGDAVAVLADQRNVAEAVLRRSEEEPINVTAPGPTITAVDLHGQTVLAPHRMDVDPEHPIAEAADYIILLSVVITSTVLLFAFWRRDPTINNLQLPDELVIADILRRGLAGAIDLLPGVWLVTRGFGLSWAQVYERWPGRGLGATWELMLPGLAAIGIVVLHTMVLEAATGRSLGKWATGLRVTTLTGERPRLWQVVVRCLLKAFDLIAYLLLILPIISPYRQRLGDMVARTVVVAKAPAEPEKEKSDGEGGER